MSRGDAHAVTPQSAFEALVQNGAAAEKVRQAANKVCNYAIVFGVEGSEGRELVVALKNALAAWDALDEQPPGPPAPQEEEE